MKKKRKIFRIKLNFIVVIILISTAAKGGEIISLNIPSDVLQRDWPVHVFLSEGFRTLEQDAVRPLLCLLHGSHGDEGDWDHIFPLLDSLVMSGDLPPLAAVAPASGTSWWVDGKEAFETAFIRELIPYMQTRYACTDSRDARVLAGFSMGGYGALRYALKYPGLFSSAILLSPALYKVLPPDGSSARSSGAFGSPFSDELWTRRNYPAVLEEYLQQDKKVFLFISAGDDDWHHKEGLRYDMEQQTVLLYGIMRKVHQNPAELRIVNGGHDWKLWLPLFIEGLSFLESQSEGFSIK